MTAKGFVFKQADLGIFKGKSAGLAIASFAPNCRIFCLTMGEFSLIDLIYAVLKRVGAADVAIVTWSAGIKDVHNVKWMFDSDLIRSIRLITDHSFKGRQEKYAMSIVDLVGAENIRTSRIHAKFVLISNRDFKVSIRTSMNLNANKTCELFELDEGLDIFDFLNNYVSTIFENQSCGFIVKNEVIAKTVDLFSKQSKNGIDGWQNL